MKRMLASALALAAICGVQASPALAVGSGDGAGLVRSLAADRCAAEKHAIGKRAFRKRYGRRGMPACVRKGRAAARRAVAAATEDCQAELDELGPESFLEDWTSFEECVGDYAEWELGPGGDEEEEEEEAL